MAKQSPKPGGVAKGRPEFLGRVVHHPLKATAAAAGVEDPHQVWYPRDQADVAAAVVRSRNVKTFVRSGTQAAATDSVDASGGVVIDLAALQGVAGDKGVVTAEAAATVAAVARQLSKDGLALPLVENPRQSIASSVLYAGPSCLARTLGPLSDYVTKVKAVTPAGRPRTLAGKSAVGQARDDKSVLTEFAFKGKSARGLWSERRAFPYPGEEEFAALLEALFLGEPVPAKCDLVVDAYSARHGIPLVRVTAAGSTAKSKAALMKLVTKALAGLPAELRSEVVPQSSAGPEVTPALVDDGYSVPPDLEIATHKLSEIVGRGPGVDVRAFLSRVAGEVDRGLGSDADPKGQSDQGLRLFTRLQLDREDRFELSSLRYTPRPVTPSAPTRRDATFAAAPAPGPAAAPAGVASFAPATLVTREETPLHAEFAFFPAAEPIILNFRGDCFVPDDWTYRGHADQYATSSYPAAATTPSVVAYPLDVADIQAALAYALAHQKRVVTRSGGHQYSGQSSGDGTAVVLSMDQFDHLDDVSEATVDVGPAVRLTRLAAELMARGVTVPHGECPFVCVGGHAQTGGYGHLLRGFGLLLDRVTQLTVVLADGSVRTVARPAGAPVTPDDRLFWGVLGGNAGSFGVVVNYRLSCVRDSEHPQSYGYSAKRRFKAPLFMGLLMEVQKWTQGVKAGTLDPDLDFMMTVESRSAWVLPPLLLVELVHSNLGGAAQVFDPAQVFSPVTQAADAGTASWERLLTRKGPQPLSVLSDSFVRRWPATTDAGREFDYPYQKRINCTGDALTDGFVAGCVALVNKVVTQSDTVRLVFQMLIGGGNYGKSSPATSIPRRDFVFCFMFDLFHDDDDDARAEAEGYQAEMQTLIDAHFSGPQEQRLFWGSFGDTNMTNPVVQNYYYDNPARYTDLRQLKRDVDPHNLFSTLLSVKP